MTVISLTLDGAAAATGMSVDVIRRAIRGGQLIAHYPTTKPVILVDELHAWIASSPTESVAERRRHP